MSDRIFVLRLKVPSFEFPPIWFFDTEADLVDSLGMAKAAGMEATWTEDYVTSADEFKTALREAGRLSQEKL